ncbi:MAG: hypothetical protein ABEI77_02525 [Halorientalis sp.]
MPSNNGLHRPTRFDRAKAITNESLALAVVPAIATVLSLSKVTTALTAGRGGGITFPFPTGLPTLWTYVSLPGVVGTGTSAAGPLSRIAFVPMFLLGLLITSALEAGLLGSLLARIEGRRSDFGASVEQFTLRMIGVNLVRAAIVLVVAPLIVVPPLALVVILALTYLVYGLPFVLVVRDCDLVTGIEHTVSLALDGGEYAAFGGAHLLVGAAASVILTALARNTGVLGILLGTAIVAVPAVFVASYGLLVFRDHVEVGASAVPSGDQSDRL